MRILVIESRRDVSVPLVNHLEDLRHCVDFASDEALATHLLANNRFDIIVLAEELSRTCGFRALANLRTLVRKPIPVLMLGTRCGQVPVVGDGTGPDGYLEPPYSLDMITGRLGILRRRKGRARSVLQVGDLVFDVAEQKARRQDQLLRIDGALLPMLQALMEASPKRVSFRELGSCLLDEPAPVAEARVRVRVRSLRDCLDRPFDAPMIRNRRDGFCILPAGPGAEATAATARGHGAPRERRAAAHAP